MPLHIKGDASKNEVRISERFLAEGAGVISLNGTDAVVEIGDPAVCGVLNCTVESGAKVIIGHSCSIINLAIHMLTSGAHLTVGDHTGFNGFVQITAHEDATIKIGNQCLFASECIISASDVHKIYDRATGIRLNPGQGITVEDHVWVASRSMILRGAKIGQGSVVGAASIVKGQLPAHSLSAGTPARVVRENIEWEF